MADFQWAYDFKPKAEPDYQAGFDPRKFRTTITQDESFTKVWGKPGANPFQLTATASFNMEETQEIERKFDVVRVKDPDNEDNHIDVEVLTKLTTQSTISKQRTSISLERTQTSSSTEILQRDQTRTSGSS